MTPAIPVKFDVVDDAMADILRQKSEGERLEIAHGMWRHARDTLLSVLRSQHPAWSEAMIEREAARRLSHGAVGAP
jgi:hypothetical protein